MKYDVAIVGAGLGGLTAGAKLAKEGRSVLIIDQHAVPGGYATTYKRDGSKVEVGLHVMDGLDPIDPKTEIFEDLGVFDALELEHPAEFYRVNNGADLDFTMPVDREEAEAALIARYPKEERGIRKFIRLILQIRREVYRVPRRNWLFYVMAPVLPFICPNVLRYQNATVADVLDKLIDEAELKLLLTANLSYYHDDPYTMSLLFFSLGQASLFAGQGHFIKGGSQVLSNHLASVIKKHGGEIVLRHRVEEIIVKNGRAVGVRYQPCSAPSTRSCVEDKPDSRAGLDAVEAFADRVIANTAIPNLARGLISDEPARQRIERLIEGKKICPPLLSLYAGFDKPLKEIGNEAYSTFLLPQEVTTMAELGANYYNDDYTRRLVLLCDYSQLDSGLDKEGRSSAAIATMDPWNNWAHLEANEYHERKKQVVEAFIGQLDRFVPGAKSHLTYTDLGTPRTMKHYTNNAEGTAYGFAQIPSQAGRNRPRSKSPIPRLHFASAWAFPGHGFSGAMMGGYWCAEEILRSRR